MRSRLAPSIRAASSNSIGIVRKNWRSKKMKKASPKKEGTINGSRVLTQLQFREHHVNGDHRHHVRQHQRGQQQRKNEVAALEAQPRKGVTRQDTADDRTDRGKDRDEDRVLGITQHGDGGEHLDIVLPAKWIGDELGRKNIDFRWLT